LLIISFFIGLLFSLGSFSYLPIVFFIAFIVFLFIPKKIPRWIILCLISLLAGYFWGEINIYRRLHEVFPKQFEANNILIEGRVTGVPMNNEQAEEFMFNIEQINQKSWQGKVSLFWYKTKNGNYPALKPGEKWRFTVKLKRPHGFRNPGVFDYDAWIFEQNIVAKGYIVDRLPYQYLAPSGYTDWIDQIRQKIAKKWHDFSSYSLFGILLAFTIGLTGDITPDQWKVFTNTGTVHLISISGFHINMMAGIAYGLVSFLWRRIPFLCERWPAQRAGALGAIILGGIYALLAGSSIPTERSLIMLCIFMGSLLFQRYIRVWQCFWWSLLVVIMLDPFAPLNLSFWLTYSAVGVILYALNDPVKKPHWFSVKNLFASLKLQSQIFLGLIPFSLFWFSQVSFSSLWANLLAIPVTGFLILPFALLAIFLQSIYFPVANFCMKIAYYFLEKLYDYLGWISHEHPFILAWSLSDISMLILGVFGTFILLAPKGFPCRWLGLIFWMPLIFPLKTPIPEGEAHFSLLDVGQGLASVIQTKNHVLVFDTGPKFNDYFDTGQAVVLPYLRNQHIRQIDALVISHKDLDHSGGLHSILENTRVKKVWVNDLHVLKTAQLCSPNIQWTWDGVTFQFLTQGLNQFDNTNDMSCVLKVSNGIHSLLLPGDLETRAEKILVKNYSDQLKTDLLIAAHHGSKTSSSPAWINATHPKYVLFATGYLNRYHFPNGDIVARYEVNKVTHWNTADCGMISWELSKNNPQKEPVCYVKKEGKRYYV
jgi:competence protein ComEC